MANPTLAAARTRLPGSPEMQTILDVWSSRRGPAFAPRLTLRHLTPRRTLDPVFQVRLVLELEGRRLEIFESQREASGALEAALRRLAERLAEFADLAAA